MIKRRIIYAVIAAAFCLLIISAAAFSASISSITIQFFGSIGHGGLTLVQGPARGITTGSSISVTLNSIPTSGDTLIAAIGILGYETVSSITESGVQWTSQVSHLSGTNSQDVEIWHGTIYPSGVSKTLTITLSGTTYLAGAIADVYEYSGILIGGYLDQTNSAEGSSTTTTTGTVTTTCPNEIAIGASIAWNLAQSSASNGFTLSDGALTSFGAGGSASLAYLNEKLFSTGTESSGVTLGQSEMYVGCIATFIARGSVAGIGSSTNVRCGVFTNGTYFSDDGYYALGSSSSTIINNAMTEVNSFGGGSVTLINGTIILDNTLIPQSNIYFKATGITIEQLTPATLGGSISLMLNTNGGVNNFVVDGGIWNSNKGTLSDHRTTGTWTPNYFLYFGISIYSDITSSNVTIKNAVVENCIGQGIDLLGCKNSYIYNCTTINDGDNPITLDSGCSNCTINNCTDIGGQDVGINTFHSTNCTIENCNVTNVTQYTGASHWGIAAENSLHVEILNNNVSNSGVGIEDALSNYTLIEGNTVTSAGAWGMEESNEGSGTDIIANNFYANNTFGAGATTLNYYTPITQVQNMTLQGNTGLSGWQTLNITLEGTGSGSISESNSWCNQGLSSISGNLWQFPTNSNIKLTATATTGSFGNYTFSNGTVATTNPFTFKMDADKSITVNFNS